MNPSIFSEFPTVAYQKAPAGTTPTCRWPTCRWYDKTRVVLGKTMEEHLRLAVAYWHSFVMNGSDPFGAATIVRPWMGGVGLEAATEKADAAFDLFRVLDVPYYCLHDRDVAPEGAAFAECRPPTSTPSPR